MRRSPGTIRHESGDRGVAHKDRHPAKNIGAWLRSAMKNSFTAALASLVVLTAVVVPATPAGAATVSGLEPLAYTEGDGPVTVAPNAVITESGSFADGYVEFSIADATATESLTLPTATTPDPTLDAVSVVGSAVYLGLGGSDFKQIGTVDPIKNGLVGKALRVNFSAVLPNADFAGSVAGAIGAQTPDGWTVNRNAVPLGALADKSQGRKVTKSGSGPYTISGTGYSFQTDFNYDASSKAPWGYESKQRGVTGTFNSDVTAYSGHDTSLRLYFSGTCPSPNDTSYCSAFGPEAWSSSFDAKAGDALAFDWSAANGGDDYEVYGFIVNQDTGVSTQLMYGRGRNQGWKTTSGTIPADGSYRFRFVAGSYDATGGYAIGASLYIDNVRVLSNDASAAVAQSVTRMVQYENTSDNPPPTRTITVETGTAGGTPTSGTVPTEVTLVDDAPTIGAIGATTYTNTIAVDTFSTATGTIPGSDPENDVITYGIDGGVADASVIGGTTYDVAKVGTYGTLHVVSTTGAWAFVPNGTAIDARLTDDSESFTVTATANGLTGTGSLPIAISVPASAPGAPTLSTATAGDGAVGLTFLAPAWLGGSDITGYVVERSTDGSNWTIAIANTGSAALTAHVSGLNNGTAYQFRVSALNSTGQSPASGVLSATPVALANAPTALAAVPGDQSAQLNWTAPSNDGGSAITGYQIESSDDGGAIWSIAVADTGSTTTAANLSDLRNGTEMQFRVSALNSVGTGAASTPVSTVPRTVPGPAAGLSLTPGDGWAVLRWSTPLDDGGAVITGYAIETSDDGGNTWVVTVADTADTKTEILLGSLVNGSEIQARVRAINVAGTGVVSPVASTVPRTVPGAPTITKVTPGNREVTVTFTPPTDDGGAAVTNYDYSVDGGTTWVPATPATRTGPIVVRRLPNGTPVTVELRAVNAAGFGAAGVAAPATPVAQPVVAPGKNVPAVPKSGAELLVDGQPQNISVTDTSKVPGSSASKGTLEINDPAGSVGLRGIDDHGKAVPLSDGKLQMVVGGVTEVSGSGYLPGSTVDVWVLPGKTLLGTVTVGADGTFSAKLAVPSGLELGDHVLQLNGVGTDGATRTLSVETTAVAAAVEVPPAVTPQPGATPAGSSGATPAGSPGITPTGGSPGSAPRMLAFTGASTAHLILLAAMLIVAGAMAIRRSEQEPKPLRGNSGSVSSKP